jgi:hypothetical protein
LNSTFGDFAIAATRFGVLMKERGRKRAQSGGTIHRLTMRERGRPISEGVLPTSPGGFGQTLGGAGYGEQTENGLLPFCYPTA